MIKNKIIFGLHLDSYRPGKNIPDAIGVSYLGPAGLLSFFEVRMGLGEPSVSEPLRIEAYRAALQSVYATNKTGYGAKSFSIDELETARYILSKRDDLVLCGWDSNIKEGPDSLKLLADVEVFACKNKSKALFSNGFADRFSVLLKELEAPEKLSADKIHFLDEIEIIDPKEFIPDHFQRLFENLKRKGIIIGFNKTEVKPFQKGDLGELQKFLSRLPSNKKVSGDGSLVIIRTSSESDAAEMISSYFRNNLKNTYQQKPVIFSESSLSELDEAFYQNGLPLTGQSSSSRYRPVLQFLPLVFSLIWKPLNIHRLLEYLTLPVHPIRRRVRNSLANALTKNPGIGNKEWNKVFEDPETDKDIIKTAREWLRLSEFENDTANAEKLAEIASKTARWAAGLANMPQLNSDEKERPYTDQLWKLSSQASMLSEILSFRKSKGGNINRVQLEKLIDLVTREGTPYSVGPALAGAPDTLTQAGQVFHELGDLFWFACLGENFSISGNSKWNEDEKKFLATNGIKAEALEAQKKNPLYYNYLMENLTRHVTGRLVLFVPDTFAGEPSGEHMFMNLMNGAFENLYEITITPTNQTSAEQNNIHKIFSVDFESVPPADLPAVMPCWQTSKNISEMTKEVRLSYSQLSDIFYHPYKYVLNRAANLQAVSILDISKLFTLSGNISHALIQEYLLLDKSNPQYAKYAGKPEEFVNHRIPVLFEEMAAPFLLPGAEQHAESVRTNSIRAIINLEDIIRKGNWEVKSKEEFVEGKFMDRDILGFIDLVLKRGKNEYAVIDIKYGGFKSHRDKISARRDLQLQIYSRLLEQKEKTSDVLRAYYIVDGRFFLSSHNFFNSSQTISIRSDETENQVWQKIENTYKWREKQLQSGIIEVCLDENELPLEPKELLPTDSILEMDKKSRPNGYHSLHIWTGESGV